MFANILCTFAEDAFVKGGLPFLPLYHSVFNLCTVSGVRGMELFPGDFLSSVILK